MRFATCAALAVLLAAAAPASAARLPLVGELLACCRRQLPWVSGPHRGRHTID